MARLKRKDMLTVRFIEENKLDKKLDSIFDAQDKRRLKQNGRKTK